MWWWNSRLGADSFTQSMRTDSTGRDQRRSRQRTRSLHPADPTHPTYQVCRTHPTDQTHPTYQTYQTDPTHQTDSTHQTFDGPACGARGVRYNRETTSLQLG